jgi:hypothetical protein
VPRALRLRREAPRLGVPVPGSVSAAIVLGLVVAANMALAVVGVALAIAGPLLRSPALWVAGIDHPFEEPPREIRTSSAGTETRAYLFQGPPEAVNLIVDNGTDAEVELVVDGALVGGVPARDGFRFAVRERSKQVEVRSRGRVLLSSSKALADFGTYVVDCTAGQTRYVARTIDEQGAAIDERPSPPGAIHDVSTYRSARGVETLGWVYLPRPRRPLLLDGAPEPAR